MIVSYETLRTLSVYLVNCTIGLLLCDEGHRLKNMDSMLMREIKKYESASRLILTGTPLQVSLYVLARSDYLHYPRITFLNSGRC